MLSCENREYRSQKVLGEPPAISSGPVLQIPVHEQNVPQDQVVHRPIEDRVLDDAPWIRPLT